MTRPSGPAPKHPERHRAIVERLADAFVPRRLHGYREQIHYLAVGGWNTLFGYLSFVALYYSLDGLLSLTAILVLSYVISVANAYVCYRYIVFRSRGSILRELPRFTSVYLVALAANLVVLPLALHYLPLSAYVVQALFTLAVVLLSYVGHRYFSFGGRQGNAGSRETSAKDPDSGESESRVPFLSVVTACFNEEQNVAEVHRQVREVLEALPPRGDEPYTWEHLFIDNASTDRTVEILRGMCAQDSRVKVVVNTRNFGHIRSPFHGLLQARGDAVISIVADLQDPPEMIRDFVAKWEEGYKVVVGVKKESLEKRSMFFVRGAFYRLIDRLSEVPLVRNFTGFGLYDRVVMDTLREIDDPYPYFRGLICDLGYARVEMPYSQPARRRGITKNNFYSLYDMAMLGITNHSKVPLRLAAMAGFALSIVALLVAVVYLVLKLTMWDTFDLGLAPLVIGVYLLGSVQLFFIGILGEYIGSIHTQVYHRPLVIEKERINFD